MALQSQKSKKKSVPWHLKPYNPNDPLDIPVFLRRALETPEQAAERRAFSNKILREEQERVRLEQQEREALSNLLNKDRTERLARKAARGERRTLRQQKKAERQEAVVKVLTAIEAGHKTVIAIKKFTGLEPPRLIKRSLRALLKAQKIVKAPGGRIYQLFWNASTVVEKTKKPKRRVRTHLPPDME